MFWILSAAYENTLQSLFSANIQNFYHKFSLYFDLWQHPKKEEENISVYSRLHQRNERTIVLAMLLLNFGCHVFFVVSFVESEVNELKKDLLIYYFEIGQLKAAYGV